MLKNIIGTTFSRMVTAIISLSIVILNANILGSEGVGTISLLVLGISVILLLSNFATGGAIIYLSPRIAPFRLIIPAYLWSALSVLIFAIVLKYVDLVPEEYKQHALILAFLQSLLTIHKNILLGKERIKIFNGVTIVQAMVLIIVLLTGFFYFNEKNVTTYVYALYFSYTLSFILSFVFSGKHLSPTSLKFVPTIRKIFKHGAYVQFANIFQLLNYRLSYYLIEFFAGRSALGVFSVAVQLSEGIWIFGRSIATVHYSKVSNTEELGKSSKITFDLLKASMIITFLVTLMVLIIPENIYISVFGEEFKNIKSIMVLLAPGIILLSGHMILSSFFSGQGKHHLNTINSVLGFLMTVLAGLILIPVFAEKGAAITASLTYLLMFGTFTYRILKQSGNNLQQLIPNQNDLKKTVGLLKSLFN